MRKFIIICLLLFSFSFADTKVIETKYSTVKYKDEIYRRADVIALCKSKYFVKTDSTKNKDKLKEKEIKYKLLLKNNGDRVLLTLRFKAKDFTIHQPLLSKQKLSEVEIETTNEILTKKFEKNNLKISLPSEDIIELRYYIMLNDKKKILLPEVFQEGNIQKKEVSKEYKTSSFTFSIPIFFEKGTAYLDKKAKFTLENFAKSIKGKDCKLVVIGFSDGTPLSDNNPNTSNEELAKKRAFVVKKFLEEYLNNE